MVAVLAVLTPAAEAPVVGQAEVAPVAEGWKTQMIQVARSIQEGHVLGPIAQPVTENKLPYSQWIKPQV